MREKRFPLPSWARGLSARLLVLTIAFVMLAEVLIYTPSIGRFRLTYLEERLAAANLAILVLEATPDQMVSESMEIELLAHAGAHSIALTKPGAGKLVLMTETPERETVKVDLRESGIVTLILDAFATLSSEGNRLIHLVGTSPMNEAVTVEVLLDEAPLRREMIAFSERILALSLIISLFTATLVFISLNWVLVRPMRRMTEAMVSFRSDPEDARRIIQPSGRDDEVGLAERELAQLQRDIRSTLHQKTRLAALGIAVSKINHDLRNILATARLVSDRLANSDDPEVRRMTPRALAAIDRAVDLCSQTLDFAQAGPLDLELAPVCLADLLNEVGDGLTAAADRELKWQIDMDPDMTAPADRRELYRVFENLGRNAFEAGADSVHLSARSNGRSVHVDLRDNGPGMPPRAREKLFQPFEASAKPGGTGLGLTIAHDIVRAHGGSLRLVASNAEGTHFRVSLPLSGPGAQPG